MNQRKGCTLGVISFQEDGSDNGIQRYEVVEEPFGGFSVFDILLGYPADISGFVLMGLSKVDAVLIGDMLNNGKRPNESYLRSLRLPQG